MGNETLRAGPSITVALLVPNNGPALSIAGLIDSFNEANKLSNGQANYDIRLISLTESYLIQTNNIKLTANTLLSNSSFNIDTLLITGTPDYRKLLKNDILLTWLKDKAPKSRRYGAVCTGVFSLGAAGLINNRRVTTHQQYIKNLSISFPQANVVSAKTYLRDENVYTCIGAYESAELALALIEEDYGNELARKVAEQLSISNYNDTYSGTDKKVCTPYDYSAEARISSIQSWIIENIDKELSLSVLASQAGMSVRNFRRVFQDKTGRTPTEFVSSIRIERTKNLLKNTSIPLQKIAYQCGFSNTDTMRKACIRDINMSPKEYRKRFHMTSTNL